MSTKVQLIELELDALRETANIATARAARALGDFVSRSVWISTPVIRWKPGPWHGEGETVHEDPNVIVSACLRGALAGSILFLVQEETALQLGRLLLGRRGDVQISDPLMRSCVVEIANILAGTYLTALSSLTGGTFELGAPAFTRAPVRQLWEDLHLSGEWPVAGLCLETSLNVGDSDQPLPCQLFLLADRGAFAGVLAGLKAWH